MCGISGLYFFNNFQEKFNDKNFLINKLSILKHRGPDDEGYWVSEDKKLILFHNRLTIIDKSKIASQPMESTDEKAIIIFNGEIYNHVSLRKELEKLGAKFKTDHSDTEVILNGYLNWGIDKLLTKLDGMYGFAIYDKINKKIILARDKIGIKPIYYYKDKNLLAFSSEIKAIISNEEVKKDFNKKSLLDYFTFLCCPHDNTLFKNINKVTPGTYIIFDQNQNFYKKKIWYPFSKKETYLKFKKGNFSQSENEILKIFREKFDNAVKKRLIADVEVGSLLSGGLDSSAIVGTMKKFQSNIKTFTIGYKETPDNNEFKHAKKIAKIFNTDHHEVIISEEDVINYMERLVYDQDEPIADNVCVPLNFISKYVKSKKIKVLLVGEGADEQFCGYYHYFSSLKYSKYLKNYNLFTPKFLRKLIAKLYLRLNKSEMLNDFLYKSSLDYDFFWSGAYLYNNERLKKLVNIYDENSSSFYEPGKYINYLSNIYKNNTGYNDELNKMIFKELSFRLPELLLMRVDKILMANSVEGRVPFLDSDLVNFTMSIPSKFKIKNNINKYLLKRSFKNFLPDEIINRKKQGFGSPVNIWIRGNLGKIMMDEVQKSQLIKENILNLDYIRSMYKDHCDQKNDYSSYLWSIFNLVVWQKKFFQTN